MPRAGSPPRAPTRSATWASLLCVTGEGTGTTAGTALVSSNCNRRGSQFWQFVVDGDYLKVTPTNTRTLFWDSPADHNSILRTTSNISAQKWEIVPVAPGFRHVLPAGPEQSLP